MKVLNTDGLLPTEIKVTNTGGLEVRTFQDVEPILDQNKRDQNNPDFNNGYTPSGDMKHVARVPLIMLQLWAKEAGISNVFGDEMKEIVKKKLNDPDNKFIRTGLGEV